MQACAQSPLPTAHLLKGMQLAILAPRTLREEEDRGAGAEQVPALLQALHLGPAVHAIDLDMAC